MKLQVFSSDILALYVIKKQKTTTIAIVHYYWRLILPHNLKALYFVLSPLYPRSVSQQFLAAGSSSSPRRHTLLVSMRLASSYGFTVTNSYLATREVVIISTIET